MTITLILEMELQNTVLLVYQSLLESSLTMDQDVSSLIPRLTLILLSQNKEEKNTNKSLGFLKGN